MAAPVGNQFWKLRAKHGRDALFSSADLLWEAASQYFDWCDKNPLETIEYNGKDAIECKVPKMRSYTYAGLCVYLGCGRTYFNDFKVSELGKTKDFSEVLTRIDDILYTQKFEGAAAGLLNQSVICRDLGLSDKQALTHYVESNIFKIGDTEIEM